MHAERVAVASPTPAPRGPGPRPVTLVSLRGPLKDLAGGRAEQAVDGATVVRAAARARARPAARSAAGSSTSAASCAATSTSSSTASAAGRRRRSAAADRVEVLPAISGGAAHDRAAGRDQEGPVRAARASPGSPFAVTARAFAGEPVEYAMRDPRSGRLLASVTSPFYGPEDLVSPTTPRASGSRPRAWRCPRAASGARADLGDRGRRGRRPAVRRRRPRRAVRRAATAGRRGSSTAALWEHPTRPEAGSRAAAGCACTRSSTVAGRPGPPRGRDLGRRRVADRRRRRDLAARQRGPRAALPARRHARRTRSSCASTTCTARRGGRSGCSCSSTAASTAPTTRARRGPTSAPGCRRTSASRSPSTRPTPTAPT